LEAAYFIAMTLMLFSLLGFLGGILSGPVSASLADYLFLKQY